MKLSVILLVCPNVFSFPTSYSSKSQENEPLKGRAAEQPARVADTSPGRASRPASKVPASAGSHHAVPAKSHRAGDHLRRLRQHHRHHLHPPHDNPEQTGRQTSRLCRQVGQSSARLVIGESRCSLM